MAEDEYEVNDEDMIGDEGEILSVSIRDTERLRHCCARAAMVMVGEELRELLRTKSTDPCFVSQATLGALRAAMGQLDTEEMTARAARLALHISSLAASLTWPKNVEIGPGRCDA